MNQPASPFSAPDPPPSRWRQLGIVAVAGLLVIILGAYAAANRRDTPDNLAQLASPTPRKATPTPSLSPSPTPVPTPNPTAQPTPAVTRAPIAPPIAALYRSGVYTVTGHYQSPGGFEALGVSLTINNDVVTAAQVINQADNRDSSHYQRLFINGYQPQVIGRNLTQVKVGRVSGSSLTPHGFNDAVTQIQAQAKR